MCDMRLLNKDFLTEFINIYRQHPALWDRRSKVYHKRAFKDKGYDALIQFFNKFGQKIERDSIAKKIQSLRGSFRKEHKKVQDSLKVGDSQVYVPSLWYYDLLMFTIEDETQTGFDNHSDNENEVTLEDFQYDHKNISNVAMLIEPGEMLNNQVYKAPKTEVSSLKRKISYEQNEPKIEIEILNECIDASKLKVKENEAFGNYIAYKLGKIKVDQQKMFAEVLLTQVVNKAILNQLSPNTILTERENQLFLQ
ncbi:uncharacterized protein LOC143918120 [Arctopsyche grandis]|uniref:uncharacterized protein LOC143918120 n=1 Tax=Arctopsyche grandis TaxID=121162 RepID=UPI00406D79BE